MTESDLPAEIVLMIRAIIDDHLRRIWAILIGMTAVAITVGGVA